LLQKPAQQICRRLDLLVLENMNQIAQRSFICAIGNRLYERRRRPTAKTTAGVCFQMAADELFPAKRTENSR